jgi:outer membrane protein assembly factor BamB
VNARTGPSGRIYWQFQADDEYLFTQPAVGPDGTIYAVGSAGPLYALSPDGGLRWVRGDVVYHRPPSVGADGTVYISGAGGLISALNTDGSLRWSYQGPGNQGAMWIGPNVGPDGNIYAV